MDDLLKSLEELDHPTDVGKCAIDEIKQLRAGNAKLSLKCAELTAALEMWKGCTPDVHVAPTFEEVVAITRARDKALASDGDPAADVLKAAVALVAEWPEHLALKESSSRLRQAVRVWKGEA